MKIVPSQYTTYVILLRLTVFLPRVAVRKRGLCCRPVSVRPSVTLVYSVHTTEDIVKFLSPPGSPITLVFWPPAPIPNSKENPFSGGAKYTGGWENFAIFDRNRRLSRKRYEILLLNAYEVICTLSNDDIFNDLHGPLSRFSRSRHFYVEYLTNFFDPWLYGQVTIEQ